MIEDSFAPVCFVKFQYHVKQGVAAVHHLDADQHWSPPRRYGYHDGCGACGDQQ
jgi:hypothetical protein